MYVRAYIQSFLVASIFVSSCRSSNVQEYYVSFEHANVTYFNPDYFEYFNVTSKRLSRGDPKYYVFAAGRVLKTLDNDLTTEVLFYEFRSNEYRRGFMEITLKLCDLIMKDKIIGQYLRKSLTCPCPIVPGEYEYNSVAFPDPPYLNTLPFRRARIMAKTCNQHTCIARGQVDLEIKQKLRLGKSSKPNNTTGNKASRT